MKEPHVVIFPYDEQGHVTPAFALARALASRGVCVTGVLTTTRYAHFSTPSTPPAAHDQPPSSASRPSPTKLLLAQRQGLMPVIISCKTMSASTILYRSLNVGSSILYPPPSCLISDVLYPWTQDLADRLCIPRFHCSAHAALVILIALHTPTLISKSLLPLRPGTGDEMIDFIPGLSKEIRLADVPLDFLGRDGNHLEVLSRIQRSLKAAAGTVINTVYELEADFVDALSAQGLCMYTIGPMAATDWEGNFNKMPSLIPEDEGCLRWLDGQPRGAVVYVALGSLVSLTEEEIGEVALGLEACEQPFLWVLRRSPTAGFDPRTVLPAGFQERMKERGCVITWAPQAAVLAHASIGCYLSHCGMGSVLEALWAGVPIIGGFSKMSDHNTNMWLVTKLWRVGMALRGGRDVGHPPPIRRDIEMRVREMIHGEEGKAISQNVVRMKAVVRKAVESSGSSHRSLSKLVEQMQAHIL